MPNYLPDDVIEKLKASVNKDKSIFGPMQKTGLESSIKVDIENKPDISTEANSMFISTADAPNVNELVTKQLEHTTNALSLRDAQELAEIDNMFSELVLSRNQRFVLANWFSARTLNGIAEMSGVTPQIILLWIRKSEDFNKAVALREKEMQLSARLILQNHLENAAITVCKASDEGSIKAAMTILENAGVIERKSDVVKQTDVNNQTAQSVNLTVNLSSHNDSLADTDTNELIEIKSEVAELLPTNESYQETS